eukprot:700222_1
MFDSFKSGASESESAALSANNMDHDAGNDLNSISPNQPNSKSKENKSKQIMRSLSSNIKDKLEKKTFHRIDVDDQPSDSPENGMANQPMDAEQQHLTDASCSDLQANDIQFTQLNNMNDLAFANENDSDEDNAEDTDISQMSHDDGYDGEHNKAARSPTTLQSTYAFCTSLKSIICHVFTMIFVSLSQVMVSAALYMIVPLHVQYTLEGGEILTGLIFLNYGFAYSVFHIFAAMSCNYYGSAFTILIGIFMGSLSLLFMVIFTDYFVWLMMMFCQGISFALFTVGSQTFVVDNICIKSRTHFDKLITAFRILAMWFGCTFSGSAIDNGSIVFATGVTFGISLCGIVLLCAFSIPPKYNDNCLVSNDITKASFMAWKASLKQLSLKQRLSVFSWMRRKNNKAVDNTPIYALDDELNLLQVFAKNASTILSISIFSFGLIFVRCVRLLVITFQCMQVDALSPSDIGYINGLSFVPELILYNISWYLLYTFGRRYTLIASHLLFVVALFNLPYSKNIASLSVVSMLFGIANGLSYGLIHKVAIDVAPTEYREKFLTLYHIFTNVAYIVAPIFVALLVQAASVVTACVCSAVVVILCLLWSVCVMTDPKKTGKRYEQLDLDKSYAAKDEEQSMSFQPNGHGLIDGKHIGPPIPNITKYKVELHSIDSVMERDQSVVENDVHSNDDYASRIADKAIHEDVQMGIELNNYNNSDAMQNQYKFEIGHFDEEEESISYQLSSSDDD